eukprot:COSAG02_NODE_1613_length_11675_cov_8.562716_4_plen_153_part_00
MRQQSELSNRLTSRRIYEYLAPNDRSVGNNYSIDDCIAVFDSSITQKAVCWDNPELKPSEIQQLYEMIFAKYELREKRGESLTPQRNYCSFPTAVLDKRTTSLTHAMWRFLRKKRHIATPHGRPMWVPHMTGPHILRGRKHSVRLELDSTAD